MQCDVGVVTQCDLAARSVTLVLYEELVTHPEAVLRRVTDACGMTWQGGLGEAFHETPRVVATASVAQVR